MAAKQQVLPETIATNGNGQAAPEKRELTPEEHLQKANKAMRKAWKMIYEDNQKARTNQNSDA